MVPLLRCSFLWGDLCQPAASAAVTSHVGLWLGQCRYDMPLFATCCSCFLNDGSHLVMACSVLQQWPICVEYKGGPWAKALLHAKANNSDIIGAIFVVRGIVLEFIFMLLAVLN